MNFDRVPTLSVGRKAKRADAPSQRQLTAKSENLACGRLHGNREILPRPDGGDAIGSHREGEEPGR
jgi:hypothetical protein